MQMKKLGRLAGLVLALICMVCALAQAGTITSQEKGYEDVHFSNGYSGYCIDRSKSGAYVGDAFSEADDTSAATSNVSNADISHSLKVLFTQCFEDIFESDGAGSYQLKNTNTVLGAVYHFSEDQYVWGDQKKLTDKVKAYEGADIPDHGYQLQLATGETVTFDFMVMVPDNPEQQYFFAYKINVSTAHACEGERTPGQTADCGTPGWEDYYTCSCGKYYADEACTQEIEDLAAWKTGDGKTTAEHTFAATYSYDENNHWYAATCGHDVTEGFAAHSGGTATCEAQAVCSTCGQPYGKKAEHDFGGYVTTDAEQHWKECDCGEKTAVGAHEYDDKKDATCNVCGHERTIAHEHEFAATYSYDENHHWYAATCGHDVTEGFAAHSGGTATCDTQAVCSTCGQPYGKKAEHDFGGYVTTDAEQHWKECDCGEKTAVGVHEYDNDEDTACNICGHARSAAVKTCVISFSANGGEGSMPARTVIAGAAQQLPAHGFARVGYVFAGWNTKQDGSGTAYENGAAIAVSSDVTLYAQWEKEPVSVPEITIDQQPQDQYVVDGQRATFSVKATGENLRYQWYIDRNNGNGWRKIDGATGSEYTTSVTEVKNDGFIYYCRVTDASGAYADSDTAELNVSSAPVLPETGDDSAPLLWAALLVMSALGMAYLRKKAFTR